MARKQLAEQWAEHRRQHEEEDRRQRVTVITEFDTGDPDATRHAMAEAILRYRLALRLLATAIGWASAGAPFGLPPQVLSGVRAAYHRWCQRRAACDVGCGHGARSGGPQSAHRSADLSAEAARRLGCPAPLQ
jgi:hypothetical protein